MNKSKIRKSMLAHKQDSPEMSHHLAYFPLLTLANNKMKVHAQGCHILEEECSGKLFVVGVYSRKKAIVNSIYHNNSVLSEQKAGSGVWITNYPRYSQAKQHKFLYLHVLFENSEECTRIHTICSLICSVILIDIADMETLSFLTAIASRVTHDKSSKNQKSNANKRKQQVSSLVFVKKSKNKELIGDLRRNSKEITDVLTHFAVQPQIGQLYNEITLFKLSSDCLEDSAYMCGVQEQIRSICCCNKKNEDLRSGPVIKEYLEIIITSLEQTGMVDIVSCTDLIRISEGYSAYLNAVEYYHENIKRHLKSEDIANIKEVLRGQREDAIDQYKKHSNDAEYLIRINQYIDEKEGKLIEENNKAHDLKNLAFLEESSSQLMAKISREKLSPEQVKPHVQAIIKDYQSKAAGDNKYELLTNYLSIIYNNAAKQSKSSTTNEVKSVQKELQQTRREKQALQESLEALRRKNSNKCCQIM